MTTWTETIAEWVTRARERTLDLVADLEDEQLFGPRLPIVNPMHWEIGHVAWFQEYWVLRHALGRPPMRTDSDRLYDSMKVAHDTRWDLPLPSRHETLASLARVRDLTLDALSRAAPEDPVLSFVLLSVFHEDMHDEAFTYTRQTLGYPAPRLHHAEHPATERPSGPWPGDARVPGGTFTLGAVAGEDPFVFDNEKWAHTVELTDFAIARAPVTQCELQAFVDDGGYHRRELWSDPGWQWRQSAGAHHPVHWRRDGSRWMRRDFDREVPLEPHRPAIHVCWYEADAYCRWAGRRLPTEAESEAAAAGETDERGGLSARKRRFPWGDSAPTPSLANLNATTMGCVDVAAHPDGDSAFGCRQMIGNVWEWTASDFLPYPGFIAYVWYQTGVLTRCTRRGGASLTLNITFDYCEWLACNSYSVDMDVNVMILLALPWRSSSPPPRRRPRGFPSC